MTWSLLLDLIVAALLVGTIYFVFRLSEQLARFRQNRQEMERLTRDLNTAIERAGIATAGLRAAAETSGHDLQKQIRQATELSDELQLMTESGNALATRLEKAASEQRGGSTVPSPEAGAPRPSDPGPRRDDTLAHFAIRDREYTRDEPDDELMDGDVTSEAERELIRALENRAGRTKTGS